MFLHRPSALAMRSFIAPAWPSGDNEAATVYVVVCQLLSFFRCLEEGLQPDSPSEEESSTALWKAFLCTRLLDLPLQSAALVRENLFFKVISMRWKFSLLLPLLFAAHGNAQVRVWEGTLELPVYEEGAPDSNPSFDQSPQTGSAIRIR